MKVSIEDTLIAIVSDRVRRRVEMWVRSGGDGLPPVAQYMEEERAVVLAAASDVLKDIAQERTTEASE